MKGEELLEEAVRRLAEELQAKAVILFGSRARGDWGPWSDYDLLIIADFKEKYLDRLKLVLSLLGDIPLSIEPHPYTLEEALHMLSKGNPLIVDALEEGIMLYSTRDFGKLLRRYVELRRKGLRRTETSIMLQE